METPWDEILAAARRRRSSRIFITHMHPDHVGGAEAAAEATGAPGDPGAARLRAVRARLGIGRLAGADRRVVHPARRAAARVGGADRVGARVRGLRPLRLEPDARRAGRRDRRLAGLATPGHADGHLEPPPRTACSIAGDTLLTPITPAIGLYPESRPDPLGDYLDTLGRLAELAPAARVRRPRAAGRRARPRAAPRSPRTTRSGSTARRPRSVPSRARGFDLSHDLFGRDLPPIQRRFAVAETLSHLERLVATAGPRGAGTTAPSPILRASPVDDLPSSTCAPGSRA